MGAQGAKDPKDPNAQEPKLLAEAHQANGAAPAAVETAPAEAPPATAPVQIRDIEVTARTTPNGASEHQIEFPPFDGYFVLMLKYPFGVELTSASATFFYAFFGSFQHCVPNHRLLAFPKEGVQHKRGLAHKGDIFDGFPSFLRLVEPEALNGLRQNHSGESGWCCYSIHFWIPPLGRFVYQPIVNKLFNIYHKW